MALPGPAPKDRKLGGAKQADWSEVPDVPFKAPRGVGLPAKIDGRAPLPQVKKWWQVVSAMPHCVLWSPSDWLFAVDTALLKQQFYLGTATGNMVTEIRRREDQMGTTAEARRKNRVRYVDPRPAEVPQPGKVSSLDDRRRRLSAS